MKKFLIASGIAALAFASVAAAQGYTFNTNLTVGSTGADVVALQTWLVNNGFKIPALSAGVPAGNFGSQTQAAVKAYQASAGIPATGFVGPITRGKLNAGGGVAVSGGMSAVCPAGFTCTSNTPTAVTCPVGFTCTATTANTGGTVTAPTGITTIGVPGTLSIANGTAVANGTTVQDGQTFDIAGYDLQSTASDQQVSSLSFDFNVRPWLYFSSFSIRNVQTGAVLATVTGLNQSNFTEITVGSDYRINIPVNFVVPKATKVTVALNGTMLTTIGRSNTNIYATQAQVRSVDGTGVTDTETLGDSTTSGSHARYVNYQGSLKANWVVALDQSSPLKQIVQTDANNPTQNVLLAVYNIKSQNMPSVLQGLVLGVKYNGAGSGVATTFNNIQLQAGGLTYYGTIDTSTGSTTFSNMNVPLAQDQYVQVKFVATVAKNITSGSASTTLVTSTTADFTGQDSAFNNPTVTNAGLVTSSDSTFSLNGVAVTAASVGTPTPVTISNSTKGASLTYTFTVSAGNSPLYIATDPALAVATSSNLGPVAASSSITRITSSVTLPGDTATAFQVPAGGSRTFTLSGSMNNANNPVLATVNAYMNITKIYYSSSSTISTLPSTYIDFGLNNLQSSPILLSN